MKLLILCMILMGSSFASTTEDGSKAGRPEFLVSGIELDPPKETNKSWIHEFETLPLGKEMDHMEQMKAQRLNQFVAK